MVYRGELNYGKMDGYAYHYEEIDGSVFAKGGFINGVFHGKCIIKAGTGFILGGNIGS